MARGGGTGSRTNKKKKTDVGAQNGTSETAGRPLKAAQANGGGDVDQVIKHKNNKQTSRKQKEETPPAPVVEEDTKEEKAKLVPTSEQLRLAQITQSQDNTMDPQRKAKISQVMDITGKSEDEVATALFDCGWDAARAIDMLLEEGGADGMGSWEETGKKKKKKNVEEEKSAGKENEDWNDDFDPNNKFDDNRERSRQRGPPRLRSRGGGQGMTREEQGNWKARENQENDRNNYEGGRGRGRGGLARGGRGGAVGGRGGGPIGGQRGGRGGGQRGFGDRGNIDSRVVERREPGSAPGEAPGRPGESFGQIETWNPVGEPAGSTAAGGAPGPVQQPGVGVGVAPGGEAGQLRARRGPVGNSKDAFDNAGNWGDDFPAAEDWDNDEYTGSLSDTKVFTPSGSGVGPKSAIGEPLNGEVRNGAAVQQPSLAAPGSKAQPSPANNSLSGSSYPQPIDISALLQKPGGLTGAPGGPTSLSQYQQAATKDLKSAIGLAPGQGSLSYSSAAPGSSFASAAPGSAFSPIKPAAVTNGSNSASKALPRARLPPPSKIPSSAVEMPGDSLSNLDVQFGGLDLQFGGSNNENNSTNFDFGAGSPPSQKQDLEKERFSSIPPGAPGKPETVGPSASLDSYKAQGASQSAGVKDVGQSLSSALASAGIKPSSSTDSVPGYGRVGEAGGSSRSSETGKSQGYGAQRSPGPLLAKAENLGGYNNGPSYSGYQGGKAGQGFPQSSGYPGGFDRQQSYNSGASSNGLTGGYSSRGGGSSAYNPPREPSYSNSYGGGGGAVNSSTATNYGSNFGASTTNYSPYTGSNSYSSTSNKSSSQQSSSNYSSSAVTTSTGPSSQFSGESGSTTAGSGKTGNSYDSTQTSSSAGTYGGVGQSSSTGSSVSSLGLSANSTLSSASKMSVNTTSGKMVPGMPPGVPGVLPAQYMIGANAAAGFPAYLANLGQAPAMAAYGGYGVGGHQLEDLAALQRSTLAASLPQLPNSGYYDPASQFGGGSAGAAGSLASRQTDPTSSFPSDSSGKFGSTGDSTSSPVPSSVAQQTQQQQQPTPFNALASTFAAAAPQQHPTLPPGYAYFYGGVGGMGAQLAAAAYGQGLPAAAGYPATHPGIPAPTVAGPTNTTQFQKQAYGSSYGNSYGDSLSLGQSNTGYKNSYGQSESQGKSNTSGSSAGHSGGPAYWTSTNGLW